MHFAAALHHLDQEYLAKHEGAPPAASATLNGIPNEQGHSDWNTRFWTPRSETWDPARFFNGLTRAFECPHQECHFVDISATKFTAHCFDAHVPSVYRCPSCLREYRSLQALVQHCESPSHRCQIRKTRGFNAFMDHITGGFISAGKRDERGEVVYEAALPNEFRDRDKEPGFW